MLFSPNESLVKTALLTCSVFSVCFLVLDWYTAVLKPSAVAAARLEPLVAIAYNASSRAYRTAVCATGQLRTLNMHPSHVHYPDKWAPMWIQPGDDSTRRERPNAPAIDLEGMTIAESIHRNFYPHLGDYDVFMTVGTRGSAVEPLAGNTTECEVLRPTGSGSALVSCDIYHELDLPVLTNTDHWRHYAYTNHVQPVLQHMYGIFRCHQSIKLHEFRTGVRYNYITRIRLECVY